VNIAIFAGDNEHAFLADLTQVDKFVGKAGMIFEIVFQGIGLTQANIDRALGVVQPAEIFQRTGAGLHLSRLVLFGQHVLQPLADSVVAAAALASGDDDGWIGGLN